MASSIFTPSQLSTFLSYIGLPPSLQTQRYAEDATADLHLLQQLHIHTISTIPYDNLSLHYSPTHQISIDPLTTFNKIVLSGRNRGGYCMENSILLHHILRGLGFPVYMSAVRIRHRTDGVPQGEYSGWVHVVNIVTLSTGARYMLDAGFGGDGATAPLPLEEADRTHTNLGAQQNRLVRDWIPTQRHRTEASKLWIYQYRNAPDHAWNSFFAFPEVEAMENDFRVVNWYTGAHPESFQTFTLLVVKFLRRPVGVGRGIAAAAEEEQEIYGKRMLVNNVVKENLGGKTRVVRECRSEEERIEALREWFGMEFTEEERRGIRGWSTELK